MTLCPILAYVPHELVDAYHRLGWMITVADLGPHKGEYAVLMGWACGCEMRLPKKVAG